jgi:hypothetical protein
VRAVTAGLLAIAATASAPAGAQFTPSLEPVPAQVGAELFLRVTSGIGFGGCYSQAPFAHLDSRRGSRLNVHVRIDDFVECHPDPQSRIVPLGILQQGVTEVAVFACADMAPPGYPLCPPSPQFLLAIDGTPAAVPVPSTSNRSLKLAGILAFLLIGLSSRAGRRARFA